MGELSRESSLQRVMRASGRVPVQCSCSICKQQCHTPCLGTPDDIERIIDAGYADRLELTNWAAGIFLGVINVAVPMIQPVAGKEWMMTDNMEVISRVLNKFQNKRRL